MLHYYICLRAWFRVFIHTFLKCILPLLSMHKPSRNKSCRRRVEIPHIDLFRNWQCQDYCASIATFPNLFPISLQVARQLVACSMHFHTGSQKMDFSEVITTAKFSPYSSPIFLEILGLSLRMRINQSLRLMNCDL